MNNPSRRAFVRSLSAFCTAAALSIHGVGYGASDLRAQAASGPTLVILVRHAEKATEPAGDPPLSAAGAERAKALVEALANAKAQPTSIIVSTTRRTAETAAPVAAKFGITPQAISLTGGAAAHISAVADSVRSKQGVVLVVGHSNTIPAIIKALGGAAMPDLCDASYSWMFTLHPAKDGKPAVVLASQYGVADPPTAESCTPMKGR
jgi:phosphohistidine phosphatase SixA